MVSRLKEERERQEVKLTCLEVGLLEPKYSVERHVKNLKAHGGLAADTATTAITGVQEAT